MATITGCLLHKNPCFLLNEKSPYLAVSSFAGTKWNGFSLSQRLCFPVSRVPHRSWVVARIGGFRPPRESRRFSKDSDDEFDAAMDLSSIRSSNVRLIDAQQNMVGVVSKGEAVQMAEEAGLDLVILSTDADPPVLRIMDYKYIRVSLSWPSVSVGNNYFCPKSSSSENIDMNNKRRKGTNRRKVLRPG